MRLVYYKNPESDMEYIREILSSDKLNIDIRVFDEETESDYIRENKPDTIIFEESAVPFGMPMFFDILCDEMIYNPEIFVYRPKSGILTKKDFVLEKPFSTSDVVKAVMSDYNCIDKYGNLDMRALISGILTELRIPSHVSGYRYLREAILITVYNPLSLDNVTNNIYTAVGRKCNTTSLSAVERSIRHAIEMAWDRADAVHFHLYFQTKKKPSNLLFISLVTNEIRKHYEKEIEKEIEIIESCKRYSKKKKSDKK